MGLPVWRTPSPCRQPDSTQHSRSPIRRRRSPSYRTDAAAYATNWTVVGNDVVSAGVSQRSPPRSPRFRMSSRRPFQGMSSGDSIPPLPPPADVIPVPPVPDVRNGPVPPDGPILDETWQSRSRPSHSHRVMQAYVTDIEAIDRDRDERVRLRSGRDRAPDSPHPYSYFPMSRYMDPFGDRERQESSRSALRDRPRREPWRDYSMDGMQLDSADLDWPNVMSPDYRAWLRSTPDYRDREERDRPRLEREATVPPSALGIADLPPLRRMSRRNIPDGPLPSSGLRESFVPADLEGTRPESASSAANADTWETMFANIVPDTNLPSVDSSFTSAAASASFSASNSNNSRSHSADSASASSFRTHVTVPDVPAEAPERPPVDWICDTDSDDEHARSTATRRTSRRRRGERDTPSSTRRPPRSTDRDPAPASARRDRLLAQLRHAGAAAARPPQDHATQPASLAGTALLPARPSGPPAPHRRSASPRARAAPIAFGYVAAAARGSGSSSSDEDDDDLAARPPFGPAELAHIEAMLAALPGRRPPPDEWWAGVGLRRTALRYAREGGGRGALLRGREDGASVERGAEGEAPEPERARTLREELERVNDFVEGLGGPQRESHL